MVVDTRAGDPEPAAGIPDPQGLRGREATDGSDALHAVKAGWSHTILPLGICLPYMNASEVPRQLRSIDQEVRVIMITGVAAPECPCPANRVWPTGAFARSEQMRLASSNDTQ